MLSWKMYVLDKFADRVLDWHCIDLEREREIYGCSVDKFSRILSVK
jgi:hypothetical protein